MGVQKYEKFLLIYQTNNKKFENHSINLSKLLILRCLYTKSYNFIKVDLDSQWRKTAGRRNGCLVHWFTGSFVQ